jgi:hypothetical protein
MERQREHAGWSRDAKHFRAPNLIRPIGVSLERRPILRLLLPTHFCLRKGNYSPLCGGLTRV